MNEAEMRASSAAKIQKILDLMKSLRVRVEARERVTPDGFIEKTIFWLDDEQYPSAAPTGATGETAEAPTGESEPAQQKVGPAQDQSAK